MTVYQRITPPSVCSREYRVALVFSRCTRRNASSPELNDISWGSALTYRGLKFALHCNFHIPKQHCRRLCSSWPLREWLWVASCLAWRSHTVHIRERKQLWDLLWMILKECAWKGLGTDWPRVSVLLPCLPARFYSSLILSLGSLRDSNPLMLLKDSQPLSCSVVLHALSEGVCVAVM